MIAIINTGERDDDGEHLYRLQINNKLISEFWHRRSDGLGECLRRAATAADLAHADEIQTLLELTPMRKS